MKKITIEIDSEEDNSRIEEHLKQWIAENFKKYEEAKIEVKDD